MDGSVYAGRSKVEVVLGPSIWAQVKSKTIIDFGCGTGEDAIEIAQHGAEQVYGIDILELATDR
jgi:ribosomal protein L11 methylase PrmA